MLRHRLISCLLFSIFLSLAFVPQNLLGDDSGPRQQLEVSINHLLDVLRDENLKGEEMQELRRERIAEVVFLQFNMRRMAKLALGRGWKSLSEAERSRFTGLFRDLLKKSYVATIDSYADEKISYRKETIKGGGKAVVETMVISAGRGEIPLNYRLRLEKEKWLIYDVIIENVSLVRNFRSQFGPVMAKKGFAGLVASMERTIAKAEGEKGG